jgi:hypothetical protein
MIPAALSIGATTAGYVGQSQAAAAQANYQNEVYRQTGQIAQQNYLDQTRAVSARLLQNAAQTAEAGQDNAVNAMQARSSASLAAAESGVEGASVDELLADFGRVETMNNLNLQTNQDWMTDQITDEQRSMQAEAQSRIAQARPGPSVQPSLLGAALQIGSAAYSSYDDYLKISRQGVYSPNSKSSGAQGHWMFKPVNKLFS